MLELLHELAILGLRPVIAHPERNGDVLKEPKRLAEMIECGAFSQVTTHSLLGAFGAKIEKCAWDLCKKGLIHLVSSDAHHVTRRGFELRESYRVIGEKLGAEWVDYFKLNSDQLLADGDFFGMPSLSVKSKDFLKRFNLFRRG
ncbi:hypothetical protein D3H35_06670 [Cohnella faecalis]|uniref:protein-tyrosine-phosphatase n=2 Tax=Cohnella faecalis TaxID=2315694 RepID=A0A398CQ18_9BACL|nr:hypothetical protein D3H35_06670 [Cohnella faecalis]